LHFNEYSFNQHENKVFRGKRFKACFTFARNISRCGVVTRQTRADVFDATGKVDETVAIVETNVAQKTENRR
jgi:hypothetical protein